MWSWDLEYAGIPISHLSLNHWFMLLCYTYIIIFSTPWENHSMLHIYRSMGTKSSDFTLGHTTKRHKFELVKGIWFICRNTDYCLDKPCKKNIFWLEISVEDLTLVNVVHWQDYLNLFGNKFFYIVFVYYIYILQNNFFTHKTLSSNLGKKGNTASLGKRVSTLS